MTRRSAHLFTVVAIVSILSLAFFSAISNVWAGVNTPQGNAVTQAPLGNGFTYQGELLQGGSPANGTFDFRFRLFDAASGGSQVGNTVTKDDVQVTKGRFTVVLDFGEGLFKGDARWLEIAVRPGNSTGPYTVLTPRQPLYPVPYALALPGLWSEMKSDSPNIVGGYSGNRVHPDVVGATIGGGGANGAEHAVDGNYGTIGGGLHNRAVGDYSTVAGGNGNTAAGFRSTVGGGGGHFVDGEFATIAGGEENTAEGDKSVIGGGFRNRATAEGATIAGGAYITVTAPYATVGGGNNNELRGQYGTIGGGVNNEAVGAYSTIAGGNGNIASGFRSTIGGGGANHAAAEFSTVAGGEENSAQGKWSTVAGGLRNTALGQGSTIAGGESITATADFATVAGGQDNEVTANYGTIPGGTGALAYNYGQFAYASGGFDDEKGTAQYSIYVLRGWSEVRSGESELFLDEQSERIFIPENTTVTFDMLVSARDAYGDAAGWIIQGVIENEGGTTQLLGTPVVTVLSNDPDWWVEPLADDVNDALTVWAGGSGPSPIRWVVVVRTAQVQW